MTPTELRKQLVKSLSTAQVESVDNNGEAVIEHEADRLLQLITADRKRVALEARLNGKWEILSKIPDGTSVLEDGKIGSAYELRIKVNREIAELKAQQEEV